MRTIRRVIGSLLLITAILITQIPVIPITASSVSSASDFQMDGSKLVKYLGSDSSVSIPDNVKVIGREAFKDNLSITSVKGGKNVKEIEYGAFLNCTYLQNITLPDSLETIGNAAFSNNVSLKSITLPQNLSSIGSGVFAGCKSLKDISIHKDNENFLCDKYALYDEKKETLISYLQGLDNSTFLMPNSVKYIDEYAFWGNDNLYEIALSNNLEEISAYSFSNCKSLRGLFIPYSVKNIDAKAFENCISLRLVEIPISVGYIHDSAFDGCPQLMIKAEENSVASQYYQNWKRVNNTAVNYGGVSGNTVIDETGMVYIIGNDGQLVEVKGGNDGSSLTSDYPDAMHDPSNVDYIPKSDPLLNVEEGVLGQTMIVGQSAVVIMDPLSVKVNNLENRSVLPEEETKAEESSLASEKGDALPKYAIVNDNITSYAYYGAGDMTTYSIPANITNIGDFAFARSGLESINIPNGVSRIGYAAFYHCDNLNEINIPASVTWIEPSAFAFTGWLQNWATNTQSSDFLIVGDGILLAYKGSSSYVEIPEGVETIGPACFMGHTEITGINIPDTVTIIGEEAFKDCFNLTALHGAEYVKKIQDRAFENTNLQDIVINKYVEEIGLGAFYCSDSATRSVVFKSDNIPVLSYTDSSERIGSKYSQMPVFKGNWTAIINSDDIEMSGNILEDTGLGFIGKIAVSNSDGTLKTIAIRNEKTSNYNNINISSSVAEWSASDITVTSSHSGEYNCVIIEQDKDRVIDAFKRIYGNILPEMKVLDISLYDSANQISFTEFGSTPLSITVPIPKNIKGNTLHVVTLDKEGQLEKVASSIQNINGKDMLTFTTNHLSIFAIYGMGEDGSIQIDQGVVQSFGEGKKDYTPNTGDNSIHPKWFIAVGIAAIAVAFLAYKPSKRRK